MENPKIDKKKAEDIEKIIKELIPGYLPKWKPTSGEPGWAIAKAFSKIVEDIIERLNQVPKKLFLTFLDKLGIKLSPPLSAKAPVTFYLSEGREENIDIPANVKLSTKDQINFETQKAFTATTAKLEALISVDPETDRAFDHSEKFKKGSPVILFAGEHENQHVLYLGDDYLFNLNRANGEKLYIRLVVPFIRNCRWEYWGVDDDGNQKWLPFKTYQNFLFKKIKYPTFKKEINGINTYWIRGVFEGHCKTEIKLNNIEIKYRSRSGIDFLFYNDIPIDLSILDKGFFYPFGPEPKLQDTFYIASNEAFSKKGFEIELRFLIKVNTQWKIEKEPVFSWEYWNGKGWKALSYNVDEWKIDNNQIKIFPKKLTFICPEDIEKTEVNGEKNYWIRVRLIGGEYGHYKIEKRELKKEFNPPEISSITIIVKGKSKPKHIFTNNNLNWEKISSFPSVIFSPISDRANTIYLGFNKPFSEGIITIFFFITKKYLKTKRYLKWSYYSKEGWKSLNVKDGTNGLIKSGICELIAPPDQNRCKKFNKDLYWVKIELIELSPNITSFIHPPSGAYSKNLTFMLSKNLAYLKNLTNFKSVQKTLDILKSTLIEPCPLYFVSFHPAIHLPTDEKEYHQIELKGIYLNTIWAIQAETIKDEIVGSSDGSPNQKFFLLRNPVLELELWVKEPLPPEDTSVNYYEDEEGGFWILWERVEDLQFSSHLSRHYTCDYITGEICFGDGKKGLIPPIGKDNIKATYKIGGGKKGNVEVGEINTLVTPIAFVDKVINHEEASGGADAEEIVSVLNRAPKKLRTRFRAITIEDYEILAKEASTEVAKVKVIPNINNFGEYQPNWVTIVIVPKSKNIAPVPSKELLKRVEDYLNKCSPLTTYVQVIPPVYVYIDVNTEVSIKNWELLPILKKEIVEKIIDFLHPLWGKEGKGWDFGEIPCFSDILAFLNKIEGISHIKNLELTLRTPDQKFIITSETPPLIDIPSYILITSGTHNIIIEGE